MRMIFIMFASKIFLSILSSNAKDGVLLKIIKKGFKIENLYK